MRKKFQAVKMPKNDEDILGDKNSQELPEDLEALEEKLYKVFVGLNYKHRYEIEEEL